MLAIKISLHSLLMIAKVIDMYARTNVDSSQGRLNFKLTSSEVLLWLQLSVYKQTHIFNWWHF